ncbi:MULTISPECIES: type VII toxin-antitoxin system MntA family adenylyltransferase antitoxin [Thermodesulfovibrio]|jgi:predicted nucleotidyltransferase|uniref:type VII toxin-antitoxin system MntA family adenylyltransferase antitoxin n=1 Tax=Thermodesulfovibrio TaxID=28261 RepID=UPI00260A4DA7|nr:nucleotidyltransferase domain-containing protein [Thermodesulfovibrio sp.]
MEKVKFYKLSERQRNRLLSLIKNELFEDPNVIFAYVFGSFIDKELKRFKDIDIALYLEDKFPRENFLDYSLQLAVELESEIKKYPIDIVILNDAPLSLSFQATQGILLFCKDENLWIDFVTKVWSLYQDYEITSRTVLADMLEKHD